MILVVSNLVAVQAASLELGEKSRASGRIVCKGQKGLTYMSLGDLIDMDVRQTKRVFVWIHPLSWHW
jgi:hypothetical protein